MASEIRVNKINSRTGVGTITLSPTGVDFTGIATVATLKATAGIVTTLTTTGNATVGGTLGVTGETTFTTHINFGDNAKAIFGNGSDLQIYHDTSGAGNSIVKEEGTGELRLGSNNAVRITKHDSETCALFTIDGAAELYYDNTKKFETKSDGVDITGELQCDTLDVDGTANIQGSLTLQSDLLMGDNDLLKIGDSDDLQISHDGSTNIINGLYHPIELRHGSEVHVKCVDDGAVELYHNNSKKFHTNAGGVQVFGNLFAGDNAKHYFGDSNDLEIYHDGSESYIADEGTGGITISGGLLSFKNQARDETHATMSVNGSVDLYHNNSKKFATKSDGVVVTGGIYLDGSGGTASANKLDDYEEGTFSPTYTSGLTSDTYSNTGGHYTKIGNFVTFTIRIAGAGTNSGSEQVKIGNLPFTSSSSAREGGAWFNYRHDLDTGGAPFMHISQGDDDIKWYNSSGSSWVGSDGSGLNNKTYHVQGFYYTDS